MRLRISKIFIGVIIFVLALLSNVVFNVPMTMVVATAAIIMLWLPLDDLVCFTLFVITFSWLTPGYLVLLAYILLLLKSERIRIMQWLPAAVIIFVEILHLSLYDFMIPSWSSVISYSSFVAIFFFLLFYRPQLSADFTKYVKFFCVGLAISMCVSSYIQLSYYELEVLLSGALRSGTIESEETGLEEILVLNANSAAYFSVTLLSCLLMGYKRLKMGIGLYVVLMVIAIASGLLSFSRTWMLVVAVIMLWYLIFEKQRNKLFMVVLMFLALFVVISQGWIEQILLTFTDRFELQNMETAGGRTELFHIYNEFWLSDISYVFFGTGTTFYKIIANMPLSIHNSIQQIYVCQGLFGLLIYILVAIYFSRNYSSPYKDYVSYIPLIAVFLFSQSLQFLMPQFLMFPILGAAYVLRINTFKRG